MKYILREDDAAADPGLSCSEGEHHAERVGCCLGRDIPSVALGIVFARGFLCLDETVEETQALARKRPVYPYIRVCSAVRSHEPECISAGKAFDLQSREGTPPRSQRCILARVRIGDARR